MGYSPICHRFLLTVKNQRYRNFITKIISARLVVMMLAMMMGQASIKTP
jgi:hypothetical protein